MPRVAHKLTDTKIKTARPKNQAYKLYDGGGLFLLVTPNGGKYWRLKYRYAGKEKLLAFGVYDHVSLAQARDKRKAAKKLLATGADPSLAKKEEKRQQIMQARNSFETVAREWHNHQAHKWTPKHSHQVLHTLEQDIFPSIGSRPVAEISPAELLDVLRAIEQRGALEVAARVLQRCGAVFRYAISTSRARTNPAADLKGALKPPVKRHYAALDARELPLFLQCLDAFPGDKTTELATKLLLLTFVRTGELIAARWDEFDLEAKIWRVPADRMKMKVEHLVPLSDQALEILAELKPITGRADLLFPNRRDIHKPMSNNTILRGLKRMGYLGKATGHGFRTTASTVLNEMGFESDAIERQLAHGERNTVRAAYNRAKYLSTRTEIMQAWANHLDSVKDDSERVVPIHRNQA